MSLAPKPASESTRVSAADLLSSIIVFLVALPLCMGIAIASGLPPAAGILTGIVGGVIVGTFAGCPLQASGPAAGLAVIVAQLVAQHGVAGLGVIIVLAGLLQMLAGYAQLGRWFQAVSPAVINGMLAGIGVLILAGQFHVMLDDPTKGNGLLNLLAIPQAIYHAVMQTQAGDLSHQAAMVGLLTISVLLVWSNVPEGLRRYVPAPLVAIVAGTVFANVAGFAIKRVDVPADLTISLTLLTPFSLLTYIKNPQIWTAAMAMAFVASAETLLSAAAVDQMHTGDRTHYNRELISQGVGNTLCGVLGILPLTGVIVRSSVNVEAGARTRWSTVMHGAWLLVAVLLLPGTLHLIPVSSLAALLVFTGYKLAHPSGVKKLEPYGQGEMIIYYITIAGVVATDLLHGVIIGLVCAALRLLSAFVRFETRLESKQDEQVELELHGTACFVTLPKLAEALDRVPKGSTLHVHARFLDYIDAACIEQLVQWEKRQQAQGGQLVVNWDELRRRQHVLVPRGD